MKPAACFILLLVSVSAFGQKKVLDTFDLLEGWNVHASDGGVTWTGRDTLPTHDNLAQWILDPSVGIDTDGNLFIATLMRRFPGYGIRVSKSTDEGQSWTQSNFALSDHVDKLHMTIDVGETSPYKNNVYIAYTDENFSPRVDKFSRSTNGGQDFSTPVVITGSIVADRTGGVNLTVGPGGEVYATWRAYNITSRRGRVGFNKSTDGGSSWGTATGIDTLLYEGSSKGLLYRNFPSMAVDRSTPSRQGWIYIVFADSSASTSPDIFLIRSKDNGATWSSRRRVNQDAGAKDQFMPWLTVDPSSGNLYVIYYDSRNFPANDSAQVYISASNDGGETFKDLSVSDPFLPKPVLHGPPGYMGSYIGIVASNGVIRPCWMDDRTGINQIYSTRIPDSIFLTSVPEVIEGTVPAAFQLYQNFPNPFNPSTEIQFSLPQKNHVTLTIFDLLGREIAALLDKDLSAGSYSTRWDAGCMPSGTYLYRLRVENFVEVRKLLLMR
ncbi:MAG: hypothetical protein A3H45_04660 [Ignavibacteria bacterium RIFCSPLOWO2_02_FULL_55_14]|nr:MAG: hypothetical protein A3H45_04660 [Ignavibacteria bacterium RIFCSPLOWO2_02_FULL_55_14]